MRRLTLAQLLRAARAIKQQIGRKIFCNFRRDRARRIRNTIDDRIGKPR